MDDSRLRTGFNMIQRLQMRIKVFSCAFPDEGPRFDCFISAKVQLPNQGIQWHLNPVAITITSGESIELDASLQAKNRQNHEIKIF